MSENFLVLCPYGIDTGLISKAVSLAHDSFVRVLVPECQAEDAAQYGAKYIHTLSDDFSNHDEAAFALYLAEKIKIWDCNIILAPATVQMRNVMSIIAWHLQAGLTADCTALNIEDGKLLQIRPAFGNSIMAQIHTTSPIQMATVRPGTYLPLERPAVDAVIVPEEQQPMESRVRVKDYRLFEEDQPLCNAKIILAGGLGIGSKAGFQKLENVAKKIGAAVAASRSAVDAGFAPYRCQVGITGVTVSPKIYIAVGISGAVQHLSGMSGSETVIAINSDPKAPIFDYADYGVVGDWEIVLDQILEEML